jgi:hypothetical protein
MGFSTTPHGSTWLLNMVFLESLQYQAAKITIRTKMNLPTCALLAELGWEPINAFLDRQSVSFFLRFFQNIKRQ